MLLQGIVGILLPTSVLKDNDIMKKQDQEDKGMSVADWIVCQLRKLLVEGVVADHQAPIHQMMRRSVREEERRLKFNKHMMMLKM
jgi:hypothetical protein